MAGAGTLRPDVIMHGFASDGDLHAVRGSLQINCSGHLVGRHVRHEVGESLIRQPIRWRDLSVYGMANSFGD